MLKFFKIATAALFLLTTPALAEEIKNPLQNGDTWADLAYDVIGDATPADGSGLFSVDAPYRAHDAAIVPLHIRQDPTSDQTITKLIIVVDENPSPVVAEFEFSPEMGHIDLETRVRLDSYSNVRVIVQTADGAMYMNGRYVKASGGCSAPALKGMEDAIANAGKMRLKLFDAATSALQTSGRQQAQVMIRHPNYSGMQRNQVTQLFIPAFFVEELKVSQGDSQLWSMVGGISISEDPVFRFAYLPNGADSFQVHATDTDGNVYEKSFEIERQGS